eukprot:COSAG01_NODE_130_length_24912_cov_83.574175_18_plen_51_part_00
MQLAGTMMLVASASHKHAIFFRLAGNRTHSQPQLYTASCLHFGVGDDAVD